MRGYIGIFAAFLHCCDKMDPRRELFDFDQFRGRCTLNEVLDALLEDEDDGEDHPIPESIFIAPPDPAVLTDEDSGDENSGGTAENLNSRQLTAEVEVRFDRQYQTSDTDVRQFDDLCGRKARTWIDGDLEPFLGPFPVVASDSSEQTAVDLFELFLDDDIINMFVLQSNQYALWKNCPDPKITASEMRCFIGILILSGYSPNANRRLYWSSESDTRNELICNAMRRNRFEEIMRFIHCVDNNELDPNDKMWKLRPFMNKIKANFMRHFVPEQNLSYDETMVKYYGQHSCKQFIRGKPIRFGYKLWSLCTPDGYLTNFEIYQGKAPNANPAYEQHFGKCAAPLLTLIDEFSSEKMKMPYHFFFDNLFTSLNLLNYFRQQGYGATGTVRENRLQKCQKLTSNKFMKKKQRGYFESAISKEDGAIVVKWMDNSVVAIASNNIGVQPLSTVKRYSQKEKTNIQVPRPYLLGEYNKYMGGVDRMDENINMYRIHIRGKKWYWPLFTWMLDACVHNAWQLQKKKNKMPQLEFRREIVLTYLKTYGVAAKGGGRPSTSKLADTARFDGINHYVKKCAKKRRCIGPYCKSKTSAVRTECMKCNVGLCVPCFALYHNKQ